MRCIGYSLSAQHGLGALYRYMGHIIPWPLHYSEVVLYVDLSVFLFIIIIKKQICANGITSESFLSNDALAPRCMEHILLQDLSFYCSGGVLLV